jgi:hypothetical protein
MTCRMNGRLFSEWIDLPLRTTRTAGHIYMAFPNVLFQKRSDPLQALMLAKLLGSRLHGCHPAGLV